MRHEDRPRTLSEAVQTAQFPVYGLADHPFDLSFSSSALGISHLAHLMSISLTFTSPHYSSNPYYYSAKSENFRITSVDATTQHPEGGHMSFNLKDPSEGQYFNKKRGVFGHYHFSEEEQKQAGNPSTWEGNLSLADTTFSGKILHWKSPLLVSAFLLKSEKTNLIGNTYGPPYEELIQLLEGLQAISHKDGLFEQYQEDLLKQYQRQIENPPI